MSTNSVTDSEVTTVMQRVASFEQVGTTGRTRRVAGVPGWHRAGGLWSQPSSHQAASYVPRHAASEAGAR